MSKKPGRPFEYDEKFVEDLADEMYTFIDKNKTCVGLNEFFILEKQMHSNIPKRFSERSEYFKNKLEDCKEVLKMRLIKGGLGIGKKLNPHFTKFVLNANYGMLEQQFIKQETDITIKSAK